MKAFSEHILIHKMVSSKQESQINCNIVDILI